MEWEEYINRGDLEPEVEEVESSWSMTDIMNVSNPWFGTKYNTGLNSYNPGKKSWDPLNTPWVRDLTPEQKFTVMTANSEEYAREKLARLDVYKDSQESLATGNLWATIPLQLGASILDPTIAIPIGVTATATRAAYTLGAKAAKLAALSAESAVVAMTGATLAVAAERGSGIHDMEYGSANLFAGLFGGGLPMMGSMLSGGYSSVKVAKSMTSDPRNLVALAGELTAEKVGGTQLKSLYTKIMPDFLQSDVTFTAASDNKYITLISNRIDSPPMAVIDKSTGEPVPIGTTGQDYKIKFNGRQRMALGDMRGMHVESTIDNYDDFMVQVGRTTRERSARQEAVVYKEIEDVVAFTKSEIEPKVQAELEQLKAEKLSKKTMGERETEIRERYNEELSIKIHEQKEEIYLNNQLEFRHQDPKVVEAAVTMDGYYKDVLEEGHRLNIHELKNIKPSRHYTTRIFDFQKVREMEIPVLTAKIHSALRGHAANVGLSEKQLAVGAEGIANKLKQLDYDRDWADFSFMVPKELGTTSYLKSKKFKLDDRQLEDILVTNAEDILGQYSYAQAGHFSANHAFPELQGIPREDQLDEFIEQFSKPLQASGAKAKEVNALKNMFEDMLGTYRIAKDSNSAVWKGTRIANSINSMTYGGGFALNTVAELGGLVMDGHVANLMKVRLGSLKETGHMFTGKTIDDPLVRDFIMMGQMENLFDTNNMMKMSDTDTVFNVNKVEHNINKGTNEFFKYTGLRGSTVALEAIVGPRIIHDIIDMGALSSIPLSKQKYLARIGINHADTIELAKTIQRVGDFTESGKIYGLNFDKWNDVELDKLTTAVGRGMRHSVIRGDSTYLPSWMIKPNAFNRLIFQFLRYPMAATETLLARGLNENAATWAAGIGTSALMYSSVIYMREQAAIAGGLMDERDAHFNDFWNDDEAAVKLFTAALAKVGNLGGLSILADRLSVVAGVPLPGNEYVSPDVLGQVLGPTFGRLPQLRNILEPLFTEGTINDKRQWNALMGLVPGATIPLISEWMRTQIRDNTY